MAKNCKITKHFTQRLVYPKTMINHKNKRSCKSRKFYLLDFIIIN